MGNKSRWTNMDIIQYVAWLFHFIQKETDTYYGNGCIWPWSQTRKEGKLRIKGIPDKINNKKSEIREEWWNADL